MYRCVRIIKRSLKKKNLKKKQKNILQIDKKRVNYIDFSYEELANQAILDDVQRGDIYRKIIDKNWENINKI